MAIKHVPIRSQQTGYHTIQGVCTLCANVHLSLPSDGKCRRCGR